MGNMSSSKNNNSNNKKINFKDFKNKIKNN